VVTAALQRRGDNLLLATSGDKGKYQTTLSHVIMCVAAGGMRGSAAF